MTEMDGKKVLKLLPASKPLNNLKPLVHSAVLCPAVKGNVSLSVHDYANTSFASTSAPAAAKISTLNTIVPKYLIFLKPLNQLEQLKATVVKQNPITLTVSGIQSSYSADRLSLQKSFAPVCLDTSTTVVKIENTPPSMKPPMLPSGHHLQIPVHANVKTLPVSVLLPIIQHKILATAAPSNTSGTSENISAPIFVSPVNTMKMSSSESLETKLVGEVSSTLIRATPQKFINSSAIEVSTSGSMENKRIPIKWVVHENPESSTSYIVPVKSSNKVASKLLKTLTDIKNTKNNSTSILPICSSSLHESLHGGKMPSIKDNTLVTCNGKVYLLAKKKDNILSTLKPSKQESTNVRKQTELISLVTDDTIINQVINLVLSKNKRIASNVKKPKFSGSMIPYLESEVNKDFKTESTPALPHDNLQISSISQHEAVSSGRSASIEINVAQKYIKKENTYDSSHKDLSSKAATDPTSPHHAVKEEEQQAKITSGMPIWMKHIQEQQKKHYLQLRKKFGLSKEERVYLRRVSSVPSKNSEAFVFSNGVQINSIDNLMSTPMKSESEKEEMIIGEQGGNLNIKRKTKAIPVLENPKKRKNDVTRMQHPDFECNIENLNNCCTQNLLEQEHSTSFLQCPHNVSNPWVTNNSEENRVLNSTSNCHENKAALNESSFRKDVFPFSLPDLEETIKDEKITRLKRFLRQREAALEVIRKKMHQC